MLDDNEPQGLESFQTTLEGTLDDGSQVYSGLWKVPRQDDPRYFVIVEPAKGKTLVYWGTPKLKETLEALEWPRGYRERTEMQEQSFKRMIDHGALDTNDGRKKSVGPDRQQQRQRAHLEAALETAQQRVAKKVEALEVHRAKVAASQSTGHGKRLGQRQQALGRVEQALKEVQHKQDHLAAQVGALGLPRERADRDVRQQTIMTMRTRLLENALMAFMAVLLGHLHSQGSVACVFPLLFERSGACRETDAEIISWVNTAGFSVPYRQLQRKVVDGLCAMDLRERGKTMCVRLRDMPP